MSLAQCNEERLRIYSNMPYNKVTTKNYTWKQKYKNAISSIKRIINSVTLFLDVVTRKRQNQALILVAISISIMRF